MNPHKDEAVPEDELEREALEARVAEDDGTGIDLCPSCLQGVPYADSLCPHCGAPISGTAGMAPWERTLAEGFIYRSAVANPRKPIVLIGVWSVFLPVLISNGFVIGWEFQRSDFHNEARWFSVFMALISVIILYQTTTNYVKGRANAAPPVAA